MDANELFERERAVRAAFSPTAPISRRDLFAGRTAQMMELITGVDEPGQHIVLFGERGVGKTSLANISRDLLGDSFVTVRVNCSTGDSFSDIWKRAFKEISIAQTVAAAGFGDNQSTVQVQTMMQIVGDPDTVTVDHVRAGLAMIGAQKPVVIFFDEFDRLSKAEVHREFADTIKTLSDQIVPATVVIVGVAGDVDGLISEHASVERALGQISMPRMSGPELAEILNRALTSVEMPIDTDALGRITKLSQGLPHYTHLLGQESAIAAVYGEGRVTKACVDVAIERALEKTQESIASLYYRATYSARDNLYKQVLLACAAAPADDRGFFSAAGVRDSLSSIVGRRMEIPSFAMHLNGFSGERGPVLRKEGVQRKFRYRFTNPLLQPYVIMRGIKDGLVSPEMLDE